VIVGGNITDVNALGNVHTLELPSHLCTDDICAINVMQKNVEIRLNLKNFISVKCAKTCVVSIVCI